MSLQKIHIWSNSETKSGPWAIGFFKVILAQGRGLKESKNIDFYLREKCSQNCISVLFYTLWASAQKRLQKYQNH